METAIYPGSFDPPTLGHVNIIARTAAIFDRVVVCILKNSAKDSGMFTVAERISMLESVTTDYPNVMIDSSSALLAEYARQYERPVIIRGLRALTDFEYEMQIASLNRRLNHQIETMMMVADNSYTYLSSSVVKQLSRFNKDLGCFVPEPVASAVYSKSGF